MSIPNIPVKTPDGVSELASRQRRLGQRHRTVLLLVDGRRPEHEVRQMAVAAGAPEACFDELLTLGLIKRNPVAAPSALPVAPARPPARPLPPDPFAPDSAPGPLAAALTLAPETVPPFDTLAGALASPAPLAELDALLDDVRTMLIRAVLAEAPVVGSMTILRLRRARSRHDIDDLLDEVEGRIDKPGKQLWVEETITRARELLQRHALQSAPVPLS